ncbi:unnamed protein product [Rhizoctonia solani]|uniref:E3 ubiquitin ligase complex SCF subunit n=1 Tax=Rhizoctonia solani TaxID=456999 RepID=A0A8H2XBT2_9AGAM|nr:unnamed protein product [Rhizoctonia solani]
MAQVTFVTSDNEQIVTSWEVYRCFGIFSPPDVPPGELEPIPLPQVSAPVLTKVIAYCEHHGYDELRPIERDQDSDDPRKRRVSEITEWDQKYIEVDQEMLFEIALAANYLDIRLLLDLACKTVANQIKGKTPEEIRKHFNIVNDYPPEEEEQIRKDNEWAEDR